MFERIGYLGPTGEFFVEGVAFNLKGAGTTVAVCPTRLLWPGTRQFEGNWITLKLILSGEGVNGERFVGESVFDGPAAMLSQLITDIDKLKSQADYRLIFPSPEVTQILEPVFECSIELVPPSRNSRVLRCRCGTPRLDEGIGAASLRDSDIHRVTAITSVVTQFDNDCLIAVQSDIANFIRWAEREMSALAIE